MTALRDTAKAKLNLTLEVLGRRADGYHELKSLVCFTALGDSVALKPGEELALSIEGPFAGALQGDNLILTKTLPVAAGLGGGSADAASAMRLLAGANPRALDEESWLKLGERLGSDVPVCLRSRPALMTGRGETVTPVRGFPSCAIVLVNPGLPLAAADVYGVLVSSDLAAPPEQPAEILDFHGSFERLIDYAAVRRNDLEGAALTLAPVIAEVLAALRSCEGAPLVRLSGSGPTCFALFATEDDAKAAATSLQAAHPSWWIVASSLDAS
jgi:4-diphosphocytidyl-2-C-methyl-D-erythritol kinase